MNNSESGRKFNHAVSTTGRAVGGAISHAKGTFTNWWSSLSTTTATTNNVTSKTGNGTLTDHHVTDNGAITIETEEIKSYNGKDDVNQEFENKDNNFEHKKQQEFLKGSIDDNVAEGIVEIGMEALILHSK